MNKILKLTFGFLLGVSLLYFVYYYRVKSVPFESLISGPEKLERAFAKVQTLVGVDLLNKIDKFETNQAEIQYLMSEVSAFEDSLGSMTRAEIAEGLKGSRADVSGFTFISNRICTADMYSEIKNELPLDDLLKHGLDVSILAGLLEDKHRPEYYARIVSYIENGRCKSDSCDVFAKIYKLFGEQSLKSKDIVDYQVRRATNSLIPLWETDEVVWNNVVKLSRRWPECFGQINANFIDYLRNDATQLRARYLLSEYKRLGATNAESLERLRPVIVFDDFLKGVTHDAWDSDFAFRFEGDLLMAISAGPDTVLDTDDDIKIY